MAAVQVPPQGGTCGIILLACEAWHSLSYKIQNDHRGARTGPLATDSIKETWRKARLSAPVPISSNLCRHDVSLIEDIGCRPGWRSYQWPPDRGTDRAACCHCPRPARSAQRYPGPGRFTEPLAEELLLPQECASAVPGSVTIRRHCLPPSTGMLIEGSMRFSSLTSIISSDGLSRATCHTISEPMEPPAPFSPSPEHH